MGKGREGSGASTTIDAPPGAPASSGGLLLLTHGSGQGRVFRLGTKKTRIGRSPSCEVSIDDPSLSREHATIQWVDGEFIVRDEGSRNGTLRNGVAVDFAVALEDGDRLTLGGVRFRFTETDESEAESRFALFGQREAGKATAGSALRRVVRTPGLASVFEQGERAARSPLSVLILGETGVGKEVLAELIHEASPRAGKELLSINCAALTETLLEAELFGHERGAFTGAVNAKPGLIEAADGGTVFFDEVGELPLSTQAKLLRVLEDRRVTRVGGRSAKPIDVRFVAATNRDLSEDVAAGRFRKDLFYRLNAVTLTLPPLRERRQDIAILADAVLSEANELTGGAPRVLGEAARAALTQHDWPGNVRELRNVIERAVVLSSGPEIGLDALPFEIPPRSAAGNVAVASSGDSLESAVDRAERERILRALDAAGGNQTHAAEALGISRRTLVTRLTQWKLTKPRRRG